jgi:hypothetical protein
MIVSIRAGLMIPWKSHIPGSGMATNRILLILPITGPRPVSSIATE